MNLVDGINFSDASSYLKDQVERLEKLSLYEIKGSQFEWKN